MIPRFGPIELLIILGFVAIVVALIIGGRKMIGGGVSGLSPTLPVGDNSQSAPVSYVTVNGQPVQRVTVVDINMSFGAMVVFMIKWALAAIPALIILFILGLVASLIFSAFFAALFGSFR